MIFHENCLLADNSHTISSLIFFGKLEKMLQNLLSAAVVIGALRLESRQILACCRNYDVQGLCLTFGQLNFCN